MEVDKEVLDERRAGCAAEEEDTLRVFIELRFLLLKCSLRPCIFGSSVVDQHRRSIHSRIVALASSAAFCVLEDLTQATVMKEALL